MSADLKDKKVLITGGTRGIGAAIADEMHAAGAQVLITGTGDAAESNSYEYHQVDFSDREAVSAFAGTIQSKSIDVLVNNAGINAIGPFQEFPTDDFDRILEVNLRTPFVLSQAVLPHMRESGWGRIINISSIFGVISKEFRAPYSTSKFGLDGMTAALAAEVSQYGILANCVAPGFTRTDMTRQVLGEDGMAELAARVPAQRLAEPIEIARLVVWLAGSENSYISGQTLTIDGGFTRV